MCIVSPSMSDTSVFHREVNHLKKSCTPYLKKLKKTRKKSCFVIRKSKKSRTDLPLNFHSSSTREQCCYPFSVPILRCIDDSVQSYDSGTWRGFSLDYWHNELMFMWCFVWSKAATEIYTFLEICIVLYSQKRLPGKSVCSVTKKAQLENCYLFGRHANIHSCKIRNWSVNT